MCLVPVAPERAMYHGCMYDTAPLFAVFYLFFFSVATFVHKLRPFEIPAGHDK